jgi:hypothetical protein
MIDRDDRILPHETPQGFNRAGGAQTLTTLPQAADFSAAASTATAVRAYFGVTTVGFFA